MFLWLPACTSPSSEPDPSQNLMQQPDLQPTLPTEPVSGPDYRIIPDSELVYGPALKDFTLETILPANSVLYSWAEEVPYTDSDLEYHGDEILEMVSRDYSVNPRLLLALLDYFTADLQADQGVDVLNKPFLKDEPTFEGLYRQLSWAANQLNRGYYSHRVGALQRITLKDGVQADISPEVNAGTAALQYVLGLLLDYPDWQLAVSPLGLRVSYLALFGDPFALAVEPLMPPGLTQPRLTLPFDPQEGWYFTGGPHAAWGSGAAWGALDFAPDEGQVGCYESHNAVLAAADGWVVRAANGSVVQNIDNHTHEGSGWTILYMHIAERGRVSDGEFLQTGDIIGYPSCEGGPSSGTHLHLARRFNGEWIPADQNLPFNLDGWISSGDGVEYDGWLTRNGWVIKALGYPSDENKFPE